LGEGSRWLAQFTQTGEDAWPQFCVGIQSNLASEVFRRILAVANAATCAVLWQLNHRDEPS
jgi:hypothetical protein